MKISEIINSSSKPAIYEKGTAVMWTDEYISKQLLKIHLDTNIDLASRRTSTIKNTTNWILENVSKKQLNILDLGCGPGLYAELLAEKGHEVTGVDFSQHSIEYARMNARKKNLNIDYSNKNYLELDLEENKFDLVIMIYTDFGVLLPTERNVLLNLVSKTLKPGGLFIFDVINDKNIEMKTTPKNWEAVKKGFWKEKPYIVLSDSFLYKKEKVILYQHIVLDENNHTDIYRFWTHHFSHSDLKEILAKNNFRHIRFDENVIPQTDNWSGENVTFCNFVNLK